MKAEPVKIETVTRTTETTTVTISGKWIFVAAKTEKERQS